MAGRSPYRTRAQEDLLSFLKSSAGKHFTAAQIKEHFEEQDKPIGTATIYRQLERFTEEGSIRKYIIGPGESACYAFVPDQQCASHFHCKCEVCGRLIHLDCDELQGIREHLQEHHGFELNAGKTVFYGICDQCNRK